MHRFWLFLRGAVPLALVALALVAVPALIAWWLTGGPFSWRHLVVGLIGAAVLVGLGGLILGWAMGRYVRRGRGE